MPATVNVNFRTVVHAKSNGICLGFPDVCLTSTPAGPVPIPYPNVAMSSDTSDGSRDVRCDGESVMLQGSAFSTSTGDEAGSVGGVISLGTKGKAKFILYSFDVRIEGKPVPRMADLMLMNEKAAPNTPPFPEIQPPSVCIAIGSPFDGDDEDNDLVDIDFVR